MKLLKHKDCPNLNNFGNLETTEDDVIKMGRAIFNLLYGSTDLRLPINKLRYKIYASKVNPPSLKCLPPTHNNSRFHILRAHTDCILQKSFAAKQPPNINITDYGCHFDNNNNELNPSINTGPIAPSYILKVVACQCCGCKTLRSSCKTMNLSCTSSCKCQAGDCQNYHTCQNLHIDSDTEN